MKLHFAFTAAGLLAFCQVSRAATLSTTAMPDAGYDVVSWNTWKGQEFKLDTTATLSLVTSVTLSVEIVVPNVNFLAQVVGSEGTPGKPNLADVRANLLPVGLPPGTGLTTITLDADPLALSPLVPGTTYWLIVGITAADPDQATPAGLVRWHYAAAYGQDAGATPGWFTGTRIADSGTAGAGWVSAVAEPYLFGITAIPVPEPGSLSLVVPAAALLLRRRRRS